MYIWRQGQLPIGQTAKARSGYRVQSLLRLTVSQLDLKLCQYLSWIGVLTREIQDATISSPYLTLRAVQCDQTTIWATPRIMCREEVGQSLQGRVRFLLRVRLQHGNYLDCSSGSISGWRRGLGIFEVAQLTRLLDKHVQMLHDLICGIAKGRSTSNPIR
jgi:hypothetical protein